MVSWQHPVFVPQANISTVLVCKAGGLCKSYSHDPARPHLCIWVHDDAPLERVEEDINTAIRSQSHNGIVSIRVVPTGDGALPLATHRFGSTKVW